MGRAEKRKNQKEKRKLRKLLAKNGINTNADRKPRGYGGIEEALKKRRTALRKSLTSATPNPGRDKAALRRRLAQLRSDDILERIDPTELAALESEASELAEGRLKRERERKNDDEDHDDEEEDEDEDDMVVEWEDVHPNNNSHHGDDDDASGGPSTGPVAQVTALTETTLPIR